MFELRDVVEKPSPEDAPSNLAIAARYVLSPAVFDAMTRVANLAAAGRETLLTGDVERFSLLMNEAFDTRRRIYTRPPWQIDQIETARRCGASAQFVGSGGAIVGVYRDAQHFDAISRAIAAIGSETIRPIVLVQMS